MKFLHPKSPSENFFWPQRDDAFWIPIEDVYCEFDPPFTWQYWTVLLFRQKTMENIESYFN